MHIHTKKDQMKIFCINLERAKERKSMIEEKWVKGLNLKINFWKAHDRRKIEEGRCVFNYDKEKSIKKLGRELSSGEIACATSHYQLFSHVLKSNIDECIIMEDDIFPLIENKKIIFEKIKEFKSEFPSSCMLLMHNPHPMQMKTCTNNIFFLRKKVSSLCKEAPWGTQFYYINKKCLSLICDYLCDNKNEITISKPADHFQKDFLSPLKLVSILNKPLCHHDWSGSSTTYIGSNLRNSVGQFIK